MIITQDSDLIGIFVQTPPNPNLTNIYLLVSKLKLCLYSWKCPLCSTSIELCASSTLHGSKPLLSSEGSGITKKTHHFGMLKTCKRNSDKHKQEKKVFLMRLFFKWPMCPGHGTGSFGKATSPGKSWDWLLLQLLGTECRPCASICRQRKMPVHHSTEVLFHLGFGIFLMVIFPKLIKTSYPKLFAQNSRLQSLLLWGLWLFLFFFFFSQGIFHHQNPNQQQHRTLPAGFPHPGSNKHQRHSCFFQKQ